MNEPSPAERRARSDLSRLARGGTLTLIGSVASSVLGFALTLLITHGLRATGAGVVFEAIALFAIVSNIAELGADTGLVRLVASFRATGRVRDIRPLLRIALWPVAVSGAAFAAAGVVWAPQLARAFIHGASRGDAVGDIRVFSLFLPAAVLTTVALSGTRGFGTMRPYVAVQSFVVPALRPILVSIVLLAGMGAVAVGVAWAVPLGVGCTLALSTLFLLLRQAEQRDRSPAHAPGPVGALAAEFWRFCIPRGISVVFTVALASIDVLMVGALRTTQEAGVYATAMRFLGVGQFSLQAASLVPGVFSEVFCLVGRLDRKFRPSAQYRKADGLGERHRGQGRLPVFLLLGRSQRQTRIPTFLAELVRHEPAGAGPLMLAVVAASIAANVNWRPEASAAVSATELVRWI